MKQNSCVILFSTQVLHFVYILLYDILLDPMGLDINIQESIANLNIISFYFLLILVFDFFTIKLLRRVFDNPKVRKNIIE